MELNYYCIPWLLRSKKYAAAIKSLKLLIAKDPEAPTTIFSALKFKLYFDNEAVSNKLKAKQKESINSAIEEIYGDQDTKTFFIENTKEKHQDCLRSQRFYLKGLRNYIGESLMKENFQNIHDILNKASQNSELKCKILPQIEDMRKIIAIAPEDLKEDLIKAADSVFYKFKDTLPQSKTE